MHILETYNHNMANQMISILNSLNANIVTLASKLKAKGFTEENNLVLNRVKALEARVKGNKPPLPLSAYTGIYTNTLYGPITIKSDGKNLKVTPLRSANIPPPMASSALLCAGVMIFGCGTYKVPR